MSQVIFKGKSFTDKDVLRAMERFDKECRRTFNQSRWRKYAVKHDGKLYPPKEILSMVTGLSVRQFGGGDTTNSRFRKLGFRIIAIVEERTSDKVGETHKVIEEDVLDVQEEVGVLESLYVSLRLDNRETAMHHLQLSEEHYLAEKWDDSIANSRKFLECVLQEIAAAHSLRVKGASLPETTYTHPVRVRDYLEREGLLEKKEKEALAKAYGFLSHTGGHPYMAQSEQAQLSRNLARIFSQFTMRRFRGSLV